MISSGTALAYYMNQDLPIEEAAKKTFKETLPGGRFFMSVVWADGSTIPIGGPHRSLINALYNENPFEGLVKWAKGKMGPAWRYPLERIRNKDYFGNKIIPDGTDGPETILREIGFVLETTAPLTAGNILRGERLDLPFSEVWKESLSEFGGSGLRLSSELNKEAARMFHDVTEYSDIDEAFLKDLVVDSPNLDAELARGNVRNIRFAPEETRGIISRLADLDDQRLRGIFGKLDTRTLDRYALALHEAGYRGQRRQISSAFGDYDKEPDGPLEEAMQEYNGILADPDSYGSDENMTDEAKRKLAELERKWDSDSDEWQFILRNTNLRPVPARAIRLLSRKMQLRFRESIQAREDHLRDIGREDLIPQMLEHFMPTEPPVDRTNGEDSPGRALSPDEQNLLDNQARVRQKYQPVGTR